MSIVLPQMRGMLARGVAGGTDPSFSSVKLLCHFDGTNGSTTFTDSSLTAIDPTIASGAPALTTTSPLFGTACLDVPSGRLGLGDRVAYNIGTGDFTVEFAMKTANPGSTYHILDMFDFSTFPSASFVISMTGGALTMYHDPGTAISGGSIATSTWQRVALSRVSGTTRLFQDGTQIGSNYTDSNNYAHHQSWFGGSGPSSVNFVGQLDELRLTVGVGRYSGNYTVDAAAFPNS